MKSLSIAAWLACASAHAGVEEWHPVDLAFAWTPGRANPFREVTFAATFKGPGGATLDVPGFYAGDGKWVVRFAPTRVGMWRYLTRSNDAKLNGLADSLVCVKNTSPQAHGRLSVDSAYPRHFRFEDGTPYFALGFEADWLGLMDFADTALPKEKKLIDLYAANGFNQVILNVYAFDTGWRKGKTGPDDYGPTAVYPWAGTNAAPDHSMLNPAFFGHFDRVMAYLFEKGIVAHLFFKVYNKQVTWPAKGSAEDSAYFAYVTARYQAYPNLIWDFSKEAYNETDKAYEARMIGLIKAKDAYHRLTTVHDDDASMSDARFVPLLDYYTDQNHSKYYATILAQHKARSWPVQNAEYEYEWGPGGANDKTYSVAQSPESVLKATYEVCMAGGYPVYYYTYHAWDVVRYAEVPAGLPPYRHLARFFSATKWYALEPHDELIGNSAAGHCLAAPGSEYVVYLNSGGTVTLSLSGTNPLTGTWMNALKGAEAVAGPFAPGARALTGPWPGTPSVLHLSADATTGIRPYGGAAGKATTPAEKIFRDGQGRARRADGRMPKHSRL